MCVGGGGEGGRVSETCEVCMGVKEWGGRERGRGRGREREREREREGERD